LGEQTAIVTGAARGIGPATTKFFLAEGRREAMVDRYGEALAKASAYLDGAIALNFDISQPDQVTQMVDEAEADLGQVDALVNNAGVADFGPIEKTDFQR